VACPTPGRVARPQAAKVGAFVERLARVLRLPWSRGRAADLGRGRRALAEAGVKRRDRKARIDRAAATLILQEYLDERKAAALATGGGEPE